MILIVDSGSTKADWCLVLPDGARKRYAGRGINPLHISPENIVKEVEERIPAELRSVAVTQLFFYGAGCSASPATDGLKQAFSHVFSQAKIDVQPDFLGAARALFGNTNGIVAILGTGSACGIYNGKDIVSTSKSLGYILGDEGSATDLGKRLLRAYFYNLMPELLAEKLKEKNVSRENVLHNVYHSATPAIYLASFFQFFIDNKNDVFLQDIVKQSFNDFANNHVKCLQACGYKLGVVGSVGFLFADIFQEVVDEHGLSHVDFLQYPIDKLVDYHILHQ